MIDREGHELGHGDPYFRYTVGQRRGLHVAAGERRYVLEVAARGERGGGRRGGGALRSRVWRGERLHWIGPPPPGPVEATVKIRSRHPGVASLVRPQADGRVEIDFAEPPARRRPRPSRRLLPGNPRPRRLLDHGATDMSPRAAMPHFLSCVVLLSVAGACPVVAKGARGYEKDLRAIEDGLRAGQWEIQRSRCDELVEQLVSAYANGKGARTLFGLALAFRAVADAGLGDSWTARWDWSVAQAFSTGATSLDLERFGDAGRKLAEITTADPQEDLVTEDEIEESGGVAPKKISGKNLRFPEPARQARFQGTVSFNFVVDTGGRPARLLRVDEHQLDEDTTIIASELEIVRGWRFRPATRNGKPVATDYNLTINLRLTGTPFWEQQP